MEACEKMCVKNGCFARAYLFSFNKYKNFIYKLIVR